jgi:hypothetical protein
VKKLVAVCAIGEAITGIALIVVPVLVAHLLFGTELSGVAIIAGRVAGMALIALGVACWPYGVGDRALCGMLTYSMFVTLYLGYVGVTGVFVGILLWPVLVLHAVLTLLLARAFLTVREGKPIP